MKLRLQAQIPHKRAFYSQKKLKVKKKLEIQEMQHYICSSQTKHPNYLNSAPVKMSWNERKEIRKKGATFSIRTAVAALYLWQAKAYCKQGSVWRERQQLLLEGLIMERD